MDSKYKIVSQPSTASQNPSKSDYQSKPHQPPPPTQFTSQATPKPWLIPTHLQERDLPTRPRTQSVQQGTPDLTISVRIPFILLGLKSLPSYIYNHAQRRTLPLEVMHTMLTRHHPDIPISLCIPKPESVRSGSDRKWELWKKEEDKGMKGIEGGWILRRGEKGGMKGSERGSGEVEGCLMESEKMMLGKGVWWCPVVLEREGCPWGNGIWREELQNILKTLEMLFNQPGADFPLRILVNSKCRTRVSVSPGKEWVEDKGGWDLETVKKMLMVVSGWEKEILSTRDVSGVAEYWCLSRFLEYLGVKKVRKQRKEYWRSLVRQGDRPKVLLERWERETREEGGMEKVLRRGLWEFFDKIEERVGGLVGFLRECETFEEKGYKFAVSFPMIYPPESEREDVGFEDKDRDEEERDELEAPPPSEISSSPEVVPPEPRANIPKIIFQSHRSTLNPADILAHIDMVVCLVSYAYWTPQADLRFKIMTFRRGAMALKHEAKESLDNLLSQIDVQRSTHAYYNSVLAENGKESPEMEHRRGMERATGAFKAVVESVERERRKERSYIGTFVRRYEKVGGFEVVGKGRLVALMKEEDALRRQRERGERKFWEGCGVNRLDELEPTVIGEDSGGRVDWGSRKGYEGSGMGKSRGGKEWKFRRKESGVLNPGKIRWEDDIDVKSPMYPREQTRILELPSRTS